MMEFRKHPQYGLCLDAGCGSGPKRPAPGFSAYCDVIAREPGVILPEPYFQCPLEDMKCFRNKEFDYARCWHVIEHTEDPDRACRELQRIARAGILAFPTPQAEHLFGRRDHNYYVYVDRGRLLFVRKRHPCYGIPRALTGCELEVRFPWEGSFSWQVVE
jgi:hypothetical protein